MKYLLLILPFMWGCAEKKIEKRVPGKVYFPSGTYNLDTVQRRILEGRAVFDTVYAVHDTLLSCYDSMAQREGISIDGVSDWDDSFPFKYTEDTLPGGHSIHVEPYDSIRLLRYDTIYLPPSVRMVPVWDTVNKIQNPK